jgi:hypothetical protein
MYKYRVVCDLLGRYLTFQGRKRRRKKDVERERKGGFEENKNRNLFNNHNVCRYVFECRESIRSMLMIFPVENVYDQQHITHWMQLKIWTFHHIVHNEK